MKVIDTETDREIREAVWIYQGTDSNGKIPVLTDEEIERHPDPIGWNRYVPDLGVNGIKVK